MLFDLIVVAWSATLGNAWITDSNHPITKSLDLSPKEEEKKIELTINGEGRI